MTYFTDSNDPNCQESFNLTFDGKPVAREQYKEFKAEEENDGKTYVIRYPANYWIGQCEYRSYGGTFYLEEKSDDPRLNQEPYNNKNQYYRLTLIHEKQLVDFSIRSDDYLLERKSNSESPTYLNQPSYDVFCFKEAMIDILNDNKEYKSFICESYESPKKHYLNRFIFYTESFWSETPNIEFNIKLSKKTYCKKGILGFEKCFEAYSNVLPREKSDLKIKKEWFDDFYDEEVKDDRP